MLLLFGSIERTLWWGNVVGFGWHTSSSSFDIHRGFLWISMDFYGFSWILIDFDGISTLVDG